jgi:Zn finger protein HypA/HybF involved in hydrogenase expression
MLERKTSKVLCPECRRKLLVICDDEGVQIVDLEEE